MTQDPNAQLVGLVRGARAILVFTGAGISTGSGIPDYRGPTGVWKTKEPVLYQDFMASHDARVEYWNQKSDGWEGFRDAEPNGTHRAVVDLERAGKLLLCITQNIDGLHKKAGLDAERIVELHGTGREVECQSCHAFSDMEPHMQLFRRTGEPERCPCGGWLKPATISFGQSLRTADLRAASEAAGECDLVIAMGSSLSVYPAADIPIAAASRGAPYVIINRGQTGHDGRSLVTLRLEGDVEQLFAPAVTAALA